MQDTKKVFESCTDFEMTDEVAEEIEENLKEFFGLILAWRKNQSSDREGEDEH